VIETVTLTDEFDFRDAIERDLEEIDGCTAIYLLRGWQHSLGARIELDRSFVLGHQVLLEFGAATPAEVIRTNGPDLTVDVAYATDRDEEPLTFAEAMSRGGVLWKAHLATQGD